jgi:hypothetical protein
VVPVVTLFLVDWFAVRKRIPDWTYWQLQLSFLTTVEILYVSSAGLTVFAAPALSCLYFRSRRSGTVSPRVARFLLCTCCLLLAFGFAEAISAVLQHRIRQNTVMPLGGLRKDNSAMSPLRFAEPPQDVDLPTEFPDGRDDREIDLVVLGESSAVGVPYQKWVSVGKIVAWQLGEAIPRRPVRLHILARSGDTLERQHQALAGLRRRPEIMIVYCGHNEFQSRLFASDDQPYYLSDSVPTSWDSFADTAARFSPLCGLIQAQADKARLALPPSPAGRRLVDVPVYTPREYATLLVDFRRRLEQIVMYAERIGAIPVLILPPANDAGFEPNRSFLSPQATHGERESFQTAFLEASRLEAENPSASSDRYRSLLAREPSFAEAHYRLARLLERMSDWINAYRHYIAARDLDGYPMRCPTAFQRAYREVAVRHGCILIDGQSYFHAIGRHGLLDDQLFQDAMHPSLRGQIALAQAVLVALHRRRVFGWRPNAPDPVIDPGRCVAHFGIDLSAWEYLSRWGRTFYSLVGRLRYDPSERRRKIDQADAAADRILAGAPPDEVGLANVGVPTPVPVLPLESMSPESAADLIEPTLPFLMERAEF